MAKRSLQLDDLRYANDRHKVAGLFKKLGYDASVNPVDLDLSSRSAESLQNSYMIANITDQDKSLQVILLELQPEEFTSHRLKVIAKNLCKRPSKFLLIGTHNYNQLMFVNPRQTLQGKPLELFFSIRKLLVDRPHPTNYDRDRLDAIAYEGEDPEKLYQKHCQAFDVEQLTKHFYSGYKQLFNLVQDIVIQYNPHPYFEDKNRLYQFCQRLLGRIMFLYFLQKKEFLGGDPSFLTTHYPTQANIEDINFYQQFLEPLFFDTLNRHRENMDSKWGKIPYLNGGLFDRDYGPNIQDALGNQTPNQILLPNRLFHPQEDNSILNFFNKYNFTVSENTPEEENVAVDPEMLGKVFENMLTAPERSQTGTFYTPRKIVQFICKQSLTRYLADTTAIALEDVEKIVSIDLDSDETQLNKLITPQQAKSLKEALTQLKSLDPAVGSGAFPLGLMQAILQLKQIIAKREGITIKKGGLFITKWKREIIANNLYGVDIKPEAIEIAKLRMWLSLVIDIPNIENVEPLPNLDYKLMCGNSLIEKINGEQLIPTPQQGKQLMLEVTPIQQAIQPLLKLQKEYFQVQNEARHHLRQEIIAAERNIFQVAINDRRQFYQGRLDNISRKLHSMKGKTSKKWEKEKQQITDKLADLEKLRENVQKGEIALNFFQYYLHFREVFESSGGFDLVIGNPPYVRQEAIKELKPLLQEEGYQCYTGVADLYVYFFEKGLQLLKPGGYLSYISSNKYFRSNYGEKLRQFLAARGRIEYLIDFGDAAIFDATVDTSIILVNKTESNIQESHQTLVFNWQSEDSLEDFDSLFTTKSFLIQQRQLTPEGWRLESPAVLKLLEKLKASGIPLGEYVNGKIYYGIKTGFNEAFVVDKTVKDQLISDHPSSAEVLKPLIRGRDVKRWCVDNPELYLIKLESSENKKHPWSDIKGKQAETIFSQTYPAIYQWLNQYRSQLKKRCDQGKFFWELRSCAYWQEFETPKIIYPDISKKSSFTITNDLFYTDCTVFFIPQQSLFLLATLNSILNNFFVSYTCPGLGEKGIRFKSVYVTKIPIPKVSETDRQIIEKLVQKCLDAKGKGVQEYEAEIDERVGHLYGLTSAEMKIIRGE